MLIAFIRLSKQKYFTPFFLLAGGFLPPIVGTLTSKCVYKPLASGVY